MTVETTPDAPGVGAEAPFRPSARGWVARRVVMALLGALVLVLPALRDPSDVRLFAQAVIYGIIGLSLNVLLGYIGQISLGHQAFVGIGAFTSAYMVSVQHQPFALAVAVAMAVGAAPGAACSGACRCESPACTSR